MKIIDHIKSAVKLATAKRSPHWPALERHFRAAHPTCAACDNKAHLQVHHRLPFHLHPELELDENNLIVLCEEAGKDCHLEIGHGGNFKGFNPHVVEDAAQTLARPESRAEVIIAARSARRFA